MTTKQHETQISTYHEYMTEAAFALLLGLRMYKQALDDDSGSGSDHTGALGEVTCRYSFLMIANSLEAAANALLLSLNLEGDTYKDLEQINTLGKFKIFCNVLGFTLDRGDFRYGCVKEIINCRNEFVHPKPRIVMVSVDQRYNLEFDIKLTGMRQYPLYFSEIKPNHALNALQDVLSFLSWVCFDICGFEIKKGALKLGLQSYGSPGDIYTIEVDNKMIFDKRTFGVDNKQPKT